MDEQKKEQKMQYTERLIAQVVRKIETMQEEIAWPAINNQDISAGDVLNQLRELLRVEAPDGKIGTLAVDEDGFFVMGETHITGERVISTRPGDFNGVVWSEEMDRPPRPE